ncbi:MAG: hypothetical protein ACRD0C_12610 [Acidimicrobiia bacterium]
MHAGRAVLVAVILTLTPAACGKSGEMSAAEKAARGACRGVTRDDIGPDADRLDFLREKEQLAVQAANADPRYDALYDARRDLRRYTEEDNSKGALEAGLRVVKECRALN